MARPSDLAPRAVFLDRDDIYSQFTFSIDKVKFLELGKMQIIFQRIKNVYQRDGVSCTIPTASNTKVDPVSAMRNYINRTNLQRLTSMDKGVFLTVMKPYHALSSSSVAAILQEAIQLAGLSGKGYTAKSFRPTAATKAVAAGCDPNIARRVGRWKSQQVFYVHTVTPDNFVILLFTSSVICNQQMDSLRTVFGTISRTAV